MTPRLVAMHAAKSSVVGLAVAVLTAHKHLTRMNRATAALAARRGRR